MNDNQLILLTGFSLGIFFGYIIGFIIGVLMRKKIKENDAFVSKTEEVKK